MEKYIYLRGLEYLTKEEKDLIIKMYGVNTNPIPTPYIWFEEKDIFHDSNTGLLEVNEILLTIWNDETLNERYNQLIERINSNNGKFTYSKSLYYKCVEESILHTLVIDTCNKYDYLNNILKTTYGYLLSDIKRILKFPIETYKPSILIDAEKDLIKLKQYDIDNFDAVDSKELDIIVDNLLKKRLENKFFYPVDGCSRGYFFEIKKEVHKYFYRDSFNKLYKKYPFLGNVRFNQYSNTNALSINVYDYHDTHKSIKIILNELLSNYNFKLEDFDLK